jgi:hypothetical protein
VWDSLDTKHIFSFRQGHVDFLDLLNLKVDQKYFEKVRGYGVYKNRIYILDHIKRIFRFDYNRANRDTVMEDPILARFIFEDEGFYRIRPLTEEIMIFLGPKGEFLSNISPHRLLEGGVLGVAFYRPSKKVLVWQQNNIGIADFTTARIEKVSIRRGSTFYGFQDIEHGTTSYFLYREGKNISQGFWVYDGSHVILRDVDTIYLVELQTEGEFIAEEILEVKRNTSVHYSEDSGKIYYLEPESGKLYSLKLLDKEKVVVEPFGSAPKYPRKEEE